MTDHPLAPRWDAVLEKRGLTAVKLYLAPDNIGTGQNAEVRLFVSGLQDPQRDYVEGWIARKEAEAARLVAEMDASGVEPRKQIERLKTYFRRRQSGA